MANTPKDLRFTSSHEWVRVEGGLAIVGISHFAQEQLGEVVHVELPEVGARVKRGASVAEVESTKAVSEVYAPVSGEVTDVNGALDDSPEAVNESPFGDGWLFKVRMSDRTEVGDLLDPQTYDAHCASEDH